MPIPQRLKRPIESVRFPSSRDAGKHYVRLVMNQRVEEILTALDPPTCDAVEISGDDHAERSWRSYRGLHYPEFDVCQPPPSELTGRFDVAIAEQVLEHVPEPLAALRTMRDLCRPGGMVLVTTPFLIRIHPSPSDYWRFTPEGLAYLMAKAGLEDVETDGWGNKPAVRGAFYSWPRRMPWQPLRDEPELPAVVWGVGRTPS